MADEEVLRSVLRADEPPDTLASLGFVIDGDSPNLRIAYPAGPAEISRFPLSDLATGFVRAWASGAAFDRWASVVLMTDWIEVDGLDTNEGQVLLNALWSVAGGEPMSEEALDLARQLART